MVAACRSKVQIKDSVWEDEEERNKSPEDQRPTNQHFLPVNKPTFPARRGREPSEVARG